MPPPTDQELINVWRDQPAPLLPLLHAFHDRDGFLSEPTLRAVSSALGIPIAELYGTVTFYHHFSQVPGGLHRPRVCTGNVCRLRGAQGLLEALEKEGATPMPCSGRCDEGGIPVLRGHTTYIGNWPQNLRAKPSELPVPNPGGFEECVFSQIRKPDRASLSGYLRTGGFEGLVNALKKSSPAGVVQLITDSKLAGRGGAGFPTGVKWKAVAEAAGEPKSIVCNADEGEPGCFKDRALMDYDPYSMIEGMILAGYACGASRGFIYLRYEYPETAVLLQQCLDALMGAGWLGDNILGTGFSFRLHLRRGAGAYICGEESSLLNSLEGKHPFPRNKPPFPVTHGFENLPSAVNNVETFCAATHIMERGAPWYRGLGLNDHAGTKLISLSGDIQRPGNYEVPFGLPLRTLLDEWAGGSLEGRTIQAVTMAGLSGGFLAGEALDQASLDEPAIRKLGSFLGAGGIIVFDDSRDMVDMAHSAMEFFAHESCGKCFPCRIGTQRLTERLDGQHAWHDLDSWLTEVRDIGATMKATSACGLGIAAPYVTESLLRYFPDQVQRHVAGSSP
ncbi:MAG: NADH-ubiquinone oxidoreductase-F iron-sulfur binding region domain-containing protein [Verrucomicrobiales bacterium]